MLYTCASGKNIEEQAASITRHVLCARQQENNVRQAVLPRVTQMQNWA